MGFSNNFKILELTYRALNVQAPIYLSNLLHIHSNMRSFHSQSRYLLVVPPTRLKTRGDGAFECVAQRLWNNLPHVRLGYSQARRSKELAVDM